MLIYSVQWRLFKIGPMFLLKSLQSDGQTDGQTDRQACSHLTTGNLIWSESDIICIFRLFFPLQNLRTWKIHNINVFWVFWYTTQVIFFKIHDNFLLFIQWHSLNVLTSKYILHTPFKLQTEENIFKTNRVHFEITYIITNKSLFPTFKRNIFLIKIVANAALKNEHREHYLFLYKLIK